MQASQLDKIKATICFIQTGLKTFSHFWSALATEGRQRIMVSQRAVVCRKAGPEKSAEPSHPSNCQHLTRQKSPSLSVPALAPSLLRLCP